MDSSIRVKIESNLFREARKAVQSCWEEFRWHTGREGVDAYKEHSSQALGLDVFGTIEVSADRDKVLGAIATDLGLPGNGEWELYLEWRDLDNVLNERTQTQIDAVARNAQALIFFEAKFTEPGGACTQAAKMICNGNYELQAKLANSETARCALTGKGIRYWEVIPKIFNYPADRDYRPCPFAGPWFQWMRNLTLCSEAAKAQGLKPAFVIIYADGPGLPIAEGVRASDPELVPEVRPEAIVLGTMSVQDLIQRAQRCVQEAGGDFQVWAELGRWVERKINSVCLKRGETRLNA